MNEVLSYLKRLLHPNDTIVVATSGGPDSMCLLHLLCELKGLNFKIVVAHVNHNLRVSSWEEAKYVESFCFKNNLIYEYMEIKEYAHDNLENNAREKRYEFFRQLVDKYHAKYLMTAHHGDDLMETILMRIVRGSSIKGYSGFKKSIDMGHYKIVRPLITLTKSEITNYMDEHKWKYFIDESNFSREYTRNRYRLDILPFLKKENPKVHLKFLKFSQELDSVCTFIDNHVKNLINDLKDENGYKINELLKLDEFLLKKIVEFELALIYVNDLFLVSDRHTEALINLIKSNKSSGVINLPKGYIAIKDYNYFKICGNKKKESFKFVLDNEVKVSNGIIRKVASSLSTNNYVIRLNSKDIKLPIIIRSRKNGDRMLVKNLDGSKKIKDIFIDEKISIKKRDGFPIVCDAEDTILWLPGVKKSKFDVETNGIYDIILSYEEE